MRLTAAAVTGFASFPLCADVRRRAELDEKVPGRGVQVE